MAISIKLLEEILSFLNEEFRVNKITLKKII